MEDAPPDPVGPPMSEAKAPRLRDWLWRPWYARLWWGCAAIFWILAALDSYIFHFFAYNGTDGWVSLPLILLHPFIIVPVLGFGFVRAWIKYVSENGDAKSAELDDAHGEAFDLFPRRLDPTNPLDPRFIMHPANPLSPASRERRFGNPH